MWINYLLLLLSLAVANALNSNFGAWVQSTSGEVWPKPNSRAVQDDFFIIRPSLFEFKVDRGTCDIITQAITRYAGILLTEAGQPSSAVEGQLDQSLGDNEFYKGELHGVRLFMEEDCGSKNSNWPHLHMKESYRLVINGSSPMASISADSVWGILRGLETFSQLVTPSGDGTNLKIKCQVIDDQPHLPHRGLLLDTSRHFIPVPDILLTLDGMAYNKLNVFHWHIVDDNSFPYESTKFPELSAKGSFHPSMVYTQTDIRNIVEYARLRGIRVMPEFDTPGHTRSWGMAYPDLLTTCYDTTGKPNGKLGPMNPTNERVYELLVDLFFELVEVFPDEYIHLGGDEVPFDCWASNQEIINYMAAHNMSRNFVLLESEFITRLLNISARVKSKSIVWQEVFDNGVTLPTTTAVHVWTGRWQKELEAATKAGHPVLLSACWYLDHLATGGDWKKYYNCNPLGFNGAANVKQLMLGGEACMWSEFVDRNNLHPRVWPRASATAERLWTADAETAEVAAHRLEEHACRMNRRGIPAQPPNGPGFCPL